MPICKICGNGYDEDACPVCTGGEPIPILAFLVNSIRFAFIAVIVIALIGMWGVAVFAVYKIFTGGEGEVLLLVPILFLLCFHFWGGTGGGGIFGGKWKL